MSISASLNIAKEALLTHMSAITVTGHNIANVNTPGYSRQVLGLTSSVSTPTAIGFQGNGVRGDSINRQYDLFMVQRLMSQNSTINNLTTQQQSMRVIETSFNEVPGLAVNELLSKLFESWQALSNNPELSSNRQTVVQQAELLNEQLQSMSNELTQTKYDTGVSLRASIGEVNSLTKQIADLNVKITTSETSKQQQNDLRDTRDTLVKNLGGYLDINYFESGSGAYQVMMSDGHSLVNNNEAWSLDWTNDKLQWVNVQSTGKETRAALDSSTTLGGKIGGLLTINDQLAEGNPKNFLGRLDGLANSIIREFNQQHSQGVGLVSFADNLTSTELADDAVLLHTTVDPLTAGETLAAGALEINGYSIGRIDAAQTSNGLAMGKTANAATAINAASAGVMAKMTTQVAGSAVNAASTLAVGDTLDFTVNDVAISYTVILADTTSQATLAGNLVSTINTAIDNYNNNVGLTSPQANVPKITIDAVLGDGSNGGVANSIVLYNTNKGDESAITINDLNSAPATTIDKIGLSAGTYLADATHNTGKLSLFSHNGPIVIDGGADDNNLVQLGWAGPGMATVDNNPDDGKLSFDYTNGHVSNSLMGLDYADTLQTDGGTFDLFLYNTNGSLALAQPVKIDLTRAYTLDDVASTINNSIKNAINDTSIPTPSPWVNASVVGNQLLLTPDGSHNFAFGNDTSNFLAAIGINTFFSGHSAGTIGLNQTVTDNLDNIAAGKINSFGEIFRGDNTNALLVTNIQGDENITFTGHGAQTDTLDGFYNSLIAEIGLRGKSINSDLEYNNLVFDQLNEIRDATSGVSLDEEMANLIKFQHAYSAAAKLISTADEMMVTLLETIR